MSGALGFGYRSSQLRGWLADLIKDAIRDYVGMRDILHGADALLLSDQAPSSNNDAWDVVEALNGSTNEAILFVYHQPDANDRVHVTPRGLQPDATYVVQSLDAGILGTTSGRDLMLDGVDVVQGSGTGAHILVLRRKP